MAPSRPPVAVPLLFSLLLLVLQLVLFPSTGALHNLATTYPNLQHLNVKQAIRDAQIHTFTPKDHHHQKVTTAEDQFSISLDQIHHQELKDTSAHKHLDLPLKLNLIHRDKLPAAATSSSSFTNHTHRLTQRLHRDAKRVAGLTRRLSPAASSSDSKQVAYSAEEFGSDVISGMGQGSGEYFVRVGVGSPARQQYMVIDSGSDVVWFQCQPCSLCYRQSDPVFDPSKSATFSGVSCGSQICDRVENSACTSGRCGYEVLYSDGSYTKGILALETLTIGSTRIRKVAIGCGHSNSGMFIGAAGLMGLGGGSLSLVGQLGGQTGGAFSYCLVSRGGSGSETGSLVFGRESLPVGAAWVNLVRNPQAPSFYYVGLSGLGVGGIRVPVPESVFELSGSGEGGVVMDTGTAVTRLPAEAYVAFRDSLLAQTANLPRTQGVSIFDTCYNLAGLVAVRVPTVSFYFKEGQMLTLPAKNFLIPVDEKGTFCLAFAPSNSALSIIGNIQQEGIQISIDGANGFVGFGPDVC